MRTLRWLIPIGAAAALAAGITASASPATPVNIIVGATTQLNEAAFLTAEEV